MMVRLLLPVLSVCGAALAQITQSNITTATKGSIVDLGYSQYQGYRDSASGQEFFLGVRYAAVPRRFQAPEKPTTNRSQVIQANVYGDVCLQNDPNIAVLVADPSVPVMGSEDCLTLNVWRPSNATGSLPVLVYIHGGGYGIGNGRNDPTFLSSITGSSFIFVSIQYRLGPFGFLSSAEIAEHGALNAGLLDQERALEWIQQYIGTFGGDPSRVTISGESAGAGSVMQLALARGGTLGNSLFSQLWAASPYLPKQYGYADAEPTRLYNQLASNVGCTYASDSYAGLFQCLNATNAQTLAKAANTVSSQSFYGTWGFAPVTDGVYLLDVPSQQLLRGKVNGQRILVGNNVREGDLFVPLVNISTASDASQYISTFLPEFSSASVSQLNQYYPDPLLSGGLYSTEAERIALLYADATFNCPGNWLADAFSESYRYQYAVPVALHGADLPLYVPSPNANYPPASYPFTRVFDSAITSFVQDGTPNLVGQNFTFPRWNNPFAYAQQVNYNVTNGLSVISPSNPAVTVEVGGTLNITSQSGLRLTNGANRCDFWRANAANVPQ